MANTIQLKRRVSGVAGAPAALKSGEIAHNEVDDTLYVGKGDDGSGNATSVIPLAGKGAFVDATSAQTVAGAKTFSTVPKSAQDASAATDLMRKSQVDAGLATKAAASHSHAIADVTGLQTALDGKSAVGHGHAIADVTGLQTALDGKAASSHSHAIANVTGLQTALDAKAPLASPALTGTPAAPTAVAGTNTTQIATTAFVAAAIAALIDAAPGTLDTLNELAAALGDDPNFAATITSGLAGKLAKASNLADLQSATTARSNLGLGTMATQASAAVAITGGSITGIAFDGGTF